jgi:predicted nucleotidyltransferase
MALSRDLNIATRHGVQQVRVFGSFARGDARADSGDDLPTEVGPVRLMFPA